MAEPAQKSRARDAIDWIDWDRVLFATDDPARILPAGVDPAKRRDFFMNNAKAVYGVRPAADLSAIL